MAGEVSQFARKLATMRPDIRRENAAFLIRIKELLEDAVKLIDREADRTGFHASK